MLFDFPSYRAWRCSGPTFVDLCRSTDEEFSHPDPGESWHPRHRHAEQLAVARSLAWSSRSGYLPTNGSTATENCRPVVQGIGLDQAVLNRLTAAARADGIEPVVHHIDRPSSMRSVPRSAFHRGPLDLEEPDAPAFLGQAFTLQRFAKRLARHTGQALHELGNLWQATLICDTNAELRAVLDRFSGRDQYRWSPSGPTTHDADLGGSGYPVLGSTYSRHFTHPGLPGVTVSVHHYVTPGRDDTFAVLRSRSRTRATGEAPRTWTMHELGTVPDNGRPTLAEAHTLARSLNDRLSGTDVDWDEDDFDPQGFFDLHRSTGD
ncbi:hypothetical protein [Streptacidiphilus sp. EB129]|uniref:hypothetical protein n=1 Tax=Streptacidiphilus sp. EB129 TaxID=3156262 RepID=UPI003511140D